MRRSRILVGNWYDYPQYCDIAFQAYTQREADFIEAACRKYCRFDVRRFLEPACGSGRLLTGLAARSYQVTGFDISQPALSYLRRRLTRRRLRAETFEAEMSDFRLGRPVDAAYCTISTFRHLLTEQAARGAGGARPPGVHCRQPSSGRHLCPRLASAAFGCRQRGRRVLDGEARRDNSDRNAARAPHRSPPPNRERSGLPAGAPRVEGTSPAARLSVPHLHGKTISMAARFGTVAGTMRRLRFPV